MIFTNLLGITCYTDSDNVIEYNNNIIELCKETILDSYLKIPIIQLNYPQNLYELEFLIEWYSMSNKEPNLEITIKDKNPYRIIMNIVYAMTLLEYKDNKLLFHQPKIDLLNYEHIINIVFPNNYVIYDGNINLSKIKYCI